MDGWEQDHPGTVLYCTDPALTVGSPDDAASPARTAPPGTGPATMATSSAGPLHEPAPPAPPAPPATAAPLTSTNATSMAPGARPASDATPTPKPRANRKCGPYADSLPSCSIAPALRTHPPGPLYPGDAGMAVSKRAVGPQREPRAAGAALHRDKTIEGFTWRMLACPCLSGASHSSTRVARYRSTRRSRMSSVAPLTDSQVLNPHGVIPVCFFSEYVAKLQGTYAKACQAVMHLLLPFLLGGPLSIPIAALQLTGQARHMAAEGLQSFLSFLNLMHRSLPRASQHWPTRPEVDQSRPGPKSRRCGRRQTGTIFLLQCFVWFVLIQPAQSATSDARVGPPHRRGPGAPHHAPLDNSEAKPSSNSRYARPPIPFLFLGQKESL